MNVDSDCAIEYRLPTKRLNAQFPIPYSKHTCYVYSPRHSREYYSRNRDLHLRVIRPLTCVEKHVVAGKWREYISTMDRSAIGCQDYR